MEKVGEGKIQDPEFFKFVLYTEMAMEMGMVTEECKTESQGPGD